LRKAGIFLEIGAGRLTGPTAEVFANPRTAEFRQFVGRELQLIGPSARVCARKPGWEEVALDWAVRNSRARNVLALKAA
jgi:hypothetical protein